MLSYHAYTQLLQHLWFCELNNSAYWQKCSAQNSYLIERGLDLDREFVRGLEGERERTFGRFFLLRSISSLANSSSGSTGCLVVSTGGCLVVSVSGRAVVIGARSLVTVHSPTNYKLSRKRH